ncbi:hypothetical protein BDDG_12959 [Blastomyces dermatitidis ATCC 18188]|uniref:Uncharacterized protein n=1 Tax=Ajellomyces dermatitidis (strain ATCC 18188 / CBS 674.68) TaxID=653446 RepID=A0A0J9EU24_AJEDA|nr:hypothetical protein BDDG_12959 [Blastomyces dermatitidis ATCC 18188]
MSKIVSRSDEKKAVVSHYQLTRLHDQEAVNELMKKSESESLKDSDMTVERDMNAEVVTEDEMKSVVQMKVKVKSAVKDIHEKKDEEKLKLTEADKQ